MASAIRYFVEFFVKNTKYAIFTLEFGKKDRVRQGEGVLERIGFHSVKGMLVWLAGGTPTKIDLYFFREMRQNSQPITEGVRFL